MFDNIGHGSHVIKLFTTITYTFSTQVRVFVHGKSFHSSLTLAGKTGAYLSEVPFRCSTLG
jgi:hypothetical protein